MKKTRTCRVLLSTILFLVLTFQLSFSQTSSYCTSTSAAPWELWIANVQFNTINNTSGKSKDFKSFGYSNYTDVSTTVTKGQTYNLNVTPGLSWMGDLPNAYCRVWIDFNKNNIFEDDEQVLGDTNKNPFTKSVLIPASASAGVTRMRVSMKVGGYATACETYFAKGEVEDYTINIQGGINLSLTGFHVLSGTPFGASGTDILIQGGNIRPIDGSLTGTNLPPTPISFKIRAYISKDQIIDSSDYLLSQLIATIKPNYTATDYLQEGGLGIINNDSKIPLGFPAGNYFLIVKIDADNEIVESNKNDNIDITNIQIVSSGINLSLTGFSVLSGTPYGAYGPDKLIQGGNVRPIDGSLTGTNLPPTPISFKIRAYISKDRVIDSSDYLLSQLIATIEPNYTSTDYLQEGGYGIINNDTKIPLDFPVGNYFLIVKIDADDEIVESNKNDNILINSIQILSNILIPTDFLRLSISSNPAIYQKFSTFNFTVKATNYSAMPITNVKVKFPFPAKIVTGGNAVASNGTWNEWCAGGAHCFEWNIPTLAPNSDATLNIPVYVQDFTGYIVVVADLVSATPPQTTNVPHISATISVPPTIGQLIGQRPILSFSASVDFDKVRLTWLSNPNNTDYFEIQSLYKGTDLPTNFTKIGQQAANLGNSTTTNIQTYNFTDTNLNEGEYAYRIKATKMDGSEQFSDIQTVRISNLNGIQIFPNPATDEIVVNCSLSVNSKVTNHQLSTDNYQLFIYNSLGIMVKSITVDGTNPLLTTDVSDLPTGAFYIRVAGKNKRDVVQRFMITR